MYSKFILLCNLDYFLNSKKIIMKVLQALYSIVFKARVNAKKGIAKL